MVLFSVKNPDDERATYARIKTNNDKRYLRLIKARLKSPSLHYCRLNEESQGTVFPVIVPIASVKLLGLKSGKTWRSKETSNAR